MQLQLQKLQKEKAEVQQQNTAQAAQLKAEHEQQLNRQKSDEKSRLGLQRSESQASDSNMIALCILVLRTTTLAACHTSNTLHWACNSILHASQVSTGSN